VGLVCDFPPDALVSRREGERRRFLPLGVVLGTVTVAEPGECPSMLSTALFSKFMLEGGVFSFLMSERDLSRVGVVGSDLTTTLLTGSLFLGLSLVRLSLLYLDKVGVLDGAN
jgi:hypothetical protein